MTTESLQKWQGISGSALKLFAVVTMLIDHIAATVLMRVLMSILNTGGGYELYDEIYMAYQIMRQIGRIAFPIYCFMLVEGLGHTRNKWKYAARLLGFALLSEIPFDLAFKSRVLEFGYQNVFFTLFIGLLTMIILEELGTKNFCQDKPKAGRWVRAILTIAVCAAGMCLAQLMRTDYGMSGVCCILVMYFLRDRRWLELVAGYIAFVLLLGEIAALPAFLALACYRGRKGFECKYFFYGFYPVHLLLLYLTCVIMGLAGYSAL